MTRPSYCQCVANTGIQSAMAADPMFVQWWTPMQSRELKRLRFQCEQLALNRVQDQLLHLYVGV